MAENNIFNTLNGVNVNENTEKKGDLTYLSWAWAWAEVKSRFADASYKILRDDRGLPYFKEDGVGYMCMTEVTINDETLMMWLPVMDYKNRAMLQPTMFDINKTIMRCLTKNLGMFGLGLYIYAGEDLPQVEQEAIKEEEAKLEREMIAPVDDKLAAEIKDLVEKTDTDVKLMLGYVKKTYGRTVKSVDELNMKEATDIKVMLQKKLG